jgi:hypothetical protein
MLRLPIPVALAVLIVTSAATIYFYITVVSNPTHGGWTDQGDGTTFTFVVPAGQWVILGTFGGSSIAISSNVTIDIRADSFTAQVWSNRLLPRGLWQVSHLYVDVKPGGFYELGQRDDPMQTCTSGSVVLLSNGMYMYYPNYTAPGASCICQWPFSSFIIRSDGTLEACGSNRWPSGYHDYVDVNDVTSYVITPNVHSTVIGINGTVYYIYTRPVYGIWVRPSANAAITVIVYP